VIRFRFVDEHRNAHGVKRMCDVLRWDRSGYYTWHANKEARQEKADAEEDLARRIGDIHTGSRGAYGARRITRKLHQQGHVVNHKRVVRIMREREISGITRRKSRCLTKQDRAARPAPDLILRDFTAPMPGLRLVGDITYLPTAEGWLYLATVIDLCTREVVGWSMAEHMRTQLVVDAIRMAHAGGHTAGNAIFHTTAGLKIRRANSVKFWPSWTSVRAPAGPGLASVTPQQRASSPFSKPRSVRPYGRPGPQLDRTFSGGSPSIATGSGSTRRSATSRRTRRGPASNNGWTSRHKTEVSEPTGSLQSSSDPT